MYVETLALRYPRTLQLRFRFVVQSIKPVPNLQTFDKFEATNSNNKQNDNSSNNNNNNKNDKNIKNKKKKQHPKSKLFSFTIKADRENQ
jgi:hypothetical protein